MESATIGFIGTIVGASIVTFLTLLARVLNARSRKKHKINEQLAFEKKYQQTILLEIQQELFEYLHIITLIYKHDCQHYDKTGSWGGLMPEELDSKNRLLGAKLVLLAERISNEDVRNNIAELRSKVALCLLANEKLIATTCLKNVNDIYEKANSTIGIALRQTFFPEQKI